MFSDRHIGILVGLDEYSKIVNKPTGFNTFICKSIIGICQNRFR
jgi:hypothetical protein